MKAIWAGALVRCLAAAQWARQPCGRNRPVWLIAKRAGMEEGVSAVVGS